MSVAYDDETVLRTTVASIVFVSDDKTFFFFFGRRLRVSCEYRLR